MLYVYLFREWTNYYNNNNMYCVFREWIILYYKKKYYMTILHISVHITTNYVFAFNMFSGNDNLASIITLKCVLPYIIMLYIYMYIFLL